MYRTKKIYLAPLSPEDSETLFDWINERDLIIFNSSYKPTHRSNHQNWFENITKNKSVYIFGLKRTEDDKLIGSCQLNHLDLIHRHAELQIRIASDENRGQGFGSDAVGLLLKFAFNDLNLNRVFLNVFANNIRAIKAYEKMGFIQEGEFKQHVFIDGHYLDIVAMAVLSENYDKQKQPDDSSTLPQD